MQVYEHDYNLHGFIEGSDNIIQPFNSFIGLRTGDYKAVACLLKAMDYPIVRLQTNLFGSSLTISSADSDTPSESSFESRIAAAIASGTTIFDLP